MKGWIGAVALVGAMASGQAIAMNGNEFLKVCQSAVRFSDTNFLDDGLGTGLCLGTMQTIGDLLPVLNTGLKPEFRVCLPDGITNGQSARISVKYMKENPAKLNQSSSLLVMTALNEVYPCK